MPKIVQSVELSRPPLSIIGTYGPSMCKFRPDGKGGYALVDSCLKALVTEGLGIVRINFSHVARADFPNIEVFIRHVRKVERELQVPIPIMMDLRGPEMRIERIGVKSGARGQVRHETRFDIKEGEKVQFFAAHTLRGKRRTAPPLSPDTRACIFVQFEGDIYDAADSGDVVVLGDNVLYLDVKKKSRTQGVICVAQNDGEIKKGQSLNIPGHRSLSIPTPVPKDREALNEGFDVDLIAQSFVQDAADVERLVGFLENTALRGKPIIAKIETQTGYENINDILGCGQVFGVMVARGDLGVLVDYAEIPRLQRDLIDSANRLGKAVIVATQMLESMMKRPRPSRSDVQDIASAIGQGADAVMLSGETAAGLYPVDCVKVMCAVIKAETPVDPVEYLRKFGGKYALPRVDRPIDTIGFAICEVAKEAQSPFIFSYASKGLSATRISRCRPNVPILAITTSQDTARLLVLSYNVYPILVGRKILPRQIEQFMRFMVEIIEGIPDLQTRIAEQIARVERDPENSERVFLVATQELSELTAPAASRGIFVFEPPPVVA